MLLAENEKRIAGSIDIDVSPAIESAQKFQQGMDIINDATQGAVEQVDNLSVAIKALNQSGTGNDVLKAYKSGVISLTEALALAKRKIDEVEIKLNSGSGSAKDVKSLSAWKTALEKIEAESEKLFTSDKRYAEERKKAFEDQRKTMEEAYRKGSVTAIDTLNDIEVKMQELQGEYDSIKARSESTWNAEEKIVVKHFDKLTSLQRSYTNRAKAENNQLEKDAQETYRSIQQSAEKAINNLNVTPKTENVGVLGSGGTTQIASQLFGAYQVINAVEDMGSTVVTINDELVELNRILPNSTTVATVNQIKDSTYEIARATGQTVEPVIEIENAWVRINDLYAQNADALAKITKATAQFMQVGQIDDADEAVTLLNATMLQFDLSVEEGIETLSKWAYMADKTALGTANEYGEATAKIGGFITNLGGGVDDAIVMTSILGDRLAKTGSEAGNSLKTIMSYLTRTKTVNLFENLAQESAEFNVVLDDMKISLMATENEFEEFTVLMDTVSSVYNKAVAQGNEVVAKQIQEALGATRQGDASIALLKNWTSDSEKYYAMIKEATGAAGDGVSYLEAQNRVKLEQISAQWNQTYVDMQEAAMNFADNGMFDIVLDVLNGVGDISEGLANMSPYVTGTISQFVKLQLILAGFSILGKITGFTKNYTAAVDENREAIIRKIAAQQAEYVEGLKKQAQNEALSKDERDAAKAELDSIKDLEGKLKAGVITQKQYNAAIAEKTKTQNIDNAITTKAEIEQSKLTKEEAKNTIVKTANTSATEKSSIKTAASTLAQKIHAKAIYASSAAWATLKTMVNSGGFAMMAMTVVVSLVIQAIKAHTEKLKENASAAAERAKETREEISTLDSLISKYKELASVDGVNADNRAEVRDIQEEICDLVGTEAEGIDLINGKYDDQIAKLEQIKREKRLASIEDNRGAISQNLLTATNEAGNRFGEDELRGDFWGNGYYDIVRSKIYDPLTSYNGSSPKSTLGSYVTFMTGNDGSDPVALYEYLLELQQQIIDKQNEGYDMTNSMSWVNDRIEELKEYVSVVKETRTEQAVLFEELGNDILTTSPLYNSLSEVQKTFVSEYIEGFSTMATESNMSADEVTSDINGLINVLSNNPSVSESITRLFSLNKNTLSATEYNTQVESIIDEIANTLAMTDEDKLKLRISLGFAEDDGASVVESLINDLDNELNLISSDQLRTLTLPQLEVVARLDGVSNYDFTSLKEEIERTVTLESITNTEDFAVALESVASAYESVSDVSSDIDKVISGNLTSSDLLELTQKYDGFWQVANKGAAEQIAFLQQVKRENEEAVNLALEERKNKLLDQREYLLKKIAEFEANGNVNTTELENTEEQLNGINAELDKIEQVRQITIELDAPSFSDFTSEFDSLISSVKSLTDAQAQLAQGTALSKQEMWELVSTYPELLLQANLFTEGSVAGQRAAIESVLDMKQVELNAIIDSYIADAEAEKQLLVAKRDITQSQLNLVSDYLEGKTNMSAEQLMAELQLLQQEKNAVEKVESNKTEANAAAVNTIVYNENQLGKAVTDTANAIGNGMSAAFAASASSSNSNVAKINSGFGKIFANANLVATAIKNAINGIRTSGSIQSGGGGAGSAGGAGTDTWKSAMSRALANSASFNAYAARTYTPSTGTTRTSSYSSEDITSKINDLKNQFKATLDSYAAEITSVDNAIANLSALKNLKIGDLAGSTGSSSGGSSGSGGSGSGSNSSSSSNLSNDEQKVLNLQSKIVSALKKLYEEQYDARLEYLEKEREAEINYKQDRIKELEDKIAQLQAEAEDDEEDLEALKTKLEKSRLDDSVIGKKKTAELEKQVAELEKELQIKQYEDEITALESDIDLIEDKYDKILDSTSEFYDSELKSLEDAITEANLYAEANAMIVANEHQKILDLLVKYEPEYAEVGQILGQSLASAMSSTIDEALKAYASISNGSSASTSTTNVSSAKTSSSVSSVSSGTSFPLTSSGKRSSAGLNIDASIIDRLKWQGFDTSKSARAKLWSYFGGSGTYKSTASQNVWLISKLKSAGYDTGGETGSWGSEGRFAFVHEKERVLSKAQTESFNKLVYDLLPRINFSKPSGEVVTNVNNQYNAPLVSIINKGDTINNTKVDAKKNNNNLAKQVSEALRSKGFRK